ncbi:hypothetical protein DPMN_062148 [Dreissena polymorpha]|uniref:Uncharacterized protein n=1 Tax=Dreissena polymorpha TaxID=45954 RepID=A0A9D4C8Y4_DREPO|nr:hypothetical protein DPMN_062148 [Dreissena polymorpha]
MGTPWPKFSVKNIPLIFKNLGRHGYGVRLATGRSRFRSPLWECSFDLPQTQVEVTYPG